MPHLKKTFPHKDTVVYLFLCIFISTSLLSMEKESRKQIFIKKDRILLPATKNPENRAVFLDHYDRAAKVTLADESLSMQALLGALTHAKLDANSSIHFNVKQECSENILKRKRAFQEKKDLKQPSSKKAKTAILEAKKYYCTFSRNCPVFSLWQCGIVTHQLSHSEKRPFICPIPNCNGSFKTKKIRKKHLKCIHEIR